MAESTIQSNKLPLDSGSLCKFLETLFTGLEVENVVYCILHGYEGLPERVENDIDMLVHPEHTKAFKCCVLQAAKKTGWVVIKNISRFGFKSFWLKSNSEHKFLQIDAWSSLHSKNIKYFDTEAVLCNRTKVKTLYAPSSAAETAYLLVKDLVETGQIKQKYKDSITKVIQDEPDDVKKILKWGFGRNIASMLVEEAANDNWNTIEKKRRKLRFAILKQSLKRNFLGLFWNFLMFLLGHFIASFKKNGFFLAIIGPDGSGKSTVAEKLDEQLSPAFRKRTFYHGHFGMTPELKSYRNFFLRLIGKKPPEQPEAGTYEAHNTPTHSLARTIVYLSYYSLDYLLGHFIVRRHQKFGNFIAFDRYFYDWFIQSYYSKTPGWLLPIFKIILPKPDLVVYLNNAPEIIHNRKQELTVEQIEEQNQKCQRIVDKMPYAMVVSTQSPPQQVANEISNRILEIMTKRFRRSL